MTKKLMMMAVAVAAAFGAWAATWTDPDSDYTWTYRINGNTAEITTGNWTSPAISPKPTGGVTIPSTLCGKPVTSIGSSAFYGCSGMTSVMIPDSVTSIGYEAFWGCSGLTSVTIPNSVTRIGYEAFYGCSSLTSVTIPNSVTSIGRSAFSGCSGLTSVTIPDNVTSIGRSAFSGCSDSLFDTTTILGVKLVDGWAVGNTGSLSGDLNLAGVRGIGSYAFRGCSGLTSVTIPDSVTSIGCEAFYRCELLENLVVPSSVTNIGCSAFAGCDSLKQVVLPKWCKTINVYYDEDEDAVLSQEPLYLKDRDHIGFVFYVFGDDDDYEDFSESKVKVVEAIITSRIMIVYVDVSGSTPISQIIQTEDVNGYTWTYSKDGAQVNVEAAFPKPSGNMAIPAVLGGANVVSVADRVFKDCGALDSVAIPETVTEIGFNAFAGCGKLWTSWFRKLSNNSAADGSMPCGSVVTTVVQQVAAPYALTNAVADRAIAEVTVDTDCAIDSFVLKDGEVYDSVLYVSNTADDSVKLTLPSGFVYKTYKGTKPLEIPAKSQCMLSITRVADKTFLVSREELEDVR